MSDAAPVVKMGPPYGSHNAVKHGVRLFLRRGKLPPGCSYVEKVIKSFRRRLINEIVDRDGSLSLHQEALIQSCCRWETVARLLEKWMREKGETLKDSDRRAYLNDIAAASDKRDACIARLKLDREDQSNILDALYNRVPEHEKRARAEPTSPGDGRSGEVPPAAGD